MSFLFSGAVNQKGRPQRAQAHLPKGKAPHVNPASLWFPFDDVHDVSSLPNRIESENRFRTSKRLRRTQTTNRASVNNLAQDQRFHLLTVKANISV